MKLMTRSAATLGALLVMAGCQRQDPEAERRALDYLATAAQEEGAVRTGTGLVYTMLGENAKAESNFQRALGLAPEDSEIRHNWGWYLCSNERPRESIPEFEIALRNPLYRTPEIALTNAGRCSAAFGDVANADSYYRRALARTPNNAPAAYGLALLAFRAGRQDEARGWMKQLTQQPAPAPEALYLGMCIERKAGDRAAETAYIAQLRNRYPDSAEAKAVTTGLCE